MTNTVHMKMGETLNVIMDDVDDGNFVVTMKCEDTKIVVSDNIGPDFYTVFLISPDDTCEEFIKEE